MPKYIYLVDSHKMPESNSPLGALLLTEPHSILFDYSPAAEKKRMSNLVTCHHNPPDNNTFGLVPHSEMPWIFLLQLIRNSHAAFSQCCAKVFDVGRAL